MALGFNHVIKLNTRIEQSAFCKKIAPSTGIAYSIGKSFERSTTGVRDLYGVWAQDIMKGEKMI